MNKHPLWMTTTKAASVLGVDSQRLREMVEEGQFPAQYVKRSGDRLIFHPYAVNPPIPTPDAISPEVIRQVASATAALNALLRQITAAGQDVPMA